MQNLTYACTGYAAILKGGKESAHTTAELARTIQLLLRAQTVETRAEVSALLRTGTSTWSSRAGATR